MKIDKEFVEWYSREDVQEWYKSLWAMTTYKAVELTVLKKQIRRLDAINQNLDVINRNLDVINQNLGQYEQRIDNLWNKVFDREEGES